MSFHRASTICGLVLGMATVVGCQEEEQVQPPPPPPPAAELEANAKSTPPARGSSKIKPGMGSEALKAAPGQ